MPYVPVWSGCYEGVLSVQADPAAIVRPDGGKRPCKKNYGWHEKDGGRDSNTNICGKVRPSQPGDIEQPANQRCVKNDSDECAKDNEASYLMCQLIDTASMPPHRSASPRAGNHGGDGESGCKDDLEPHESARPRKNSSVQEASERRADESSRRVIMYGVRYQSN